MSLINIKEAKRENNLKENVKRKLIREQLELEKNFQKFDPLIYKQKETDQTQIKLYKK